MDFNTSGIEVFLEEDFEDHEERSDIQGVFKKLVEDIPGDCLNEFEPGFEDDIHEDYGDYEDYEADDYEELVVNVDPADFNNYDESDCDSAFSDDNFDDDDDDDDDVDSVCSNNDLGYSGWMSSEDDEEIEQLVLGYQIDFNGINHDDTIWRNFITTARANYLLGNYSNELYFFYLQQLNKGLFDIRRGFTPEDTPEQQLRLQEE